MSLEQCAQHWLNAVSAYPTLPYYLGLIDVFYHNLTVRCYAMDHSSQPKTKNPNRG